MSWLGARAASTTRRAGLGAVNPVVRARATGGAAYAAASKVTAGRRDASTTVSMRPCATRNRMELVTMSFHRLEQFANLAVIVAAVVFCIVAYNYLAPASPSGPRQAPIYSPGDDLGRIPGVETRGRRSVVFFLSSTCGYCTDSMPFYRDVVEWVSSDRSLRETTQLIVIGREDESSLWQYVRANAFEPDYVARVTEQDTPRLALTPTVVLADEDGVVEAAWIGLFDQSKRDRFFSVLVSPTRAAK